MLKYIVAVACGLSLAGSVYMTGWGSAAKSSGMCEDCCAPGSNMVSASSVVDTTGLIDVKNSKCIVSGGDVAGSTKTVSYKGKAYHICCDDCVAPFNKDPEKYVKVLEADPAKFGVKKQ